MAFARLRATYARGSELVRRVLATVPLVRSILTGLVRIEVIDRSMAIAAQAMLALVPMLAVMAAFLPEITEIALERFRDVTGVGNQATDLVGEELNTDQVRAQTGVVGILITLFSATSFARAVQRMYERVWERRHIGGVLGLRRSVLWLIGWLMTVQAISAIGFVLNEVDSFDVLRFVLQGATGSLVWWWTSRTLLFGRVSWGQLSIGAMLTGFCLVLYSWGSGLVMPPYVESSVDQLGTLGLILAITTWLVGFAGVLVVASVVGRALVEDEDVVRLSRLVWSWGQRILPRRSRRASG
jgi:membrane protein